jgi:hypothetical protein
MNVPFMSPTRAESAGVGDPPILAQASGLQIMRSSPLATLRVVTRPRLSLFLRVRATLIGPRYVGCVCFWAVESLKYSSDSGTSRGPSRGPPCDMPETRARAQVNTLCIGRRNAGVEKVEEKGALYGRE